MGVNASVKRQRSLESNLSGRLNWLLAARLGSQTPTRVPLAARNCRLRSGDCRGSSRERVGFCRFLHLIESFLALVALRHMAGAPPIDWCCCRLTLVIIRL